MSEEEQEIRRVVAELGKELGTLVFPTAYFRKVLATLDVLRETDDSISVRALHSMLDDAQRERDAARADADELRARLRTPRGRWILLGRAHEHARRARAQRDHVASEADAWRAACAAEVLRLREIERAARALLAVRTTGHGDALAEILAQRALRAALGEP